MPTCKDCLHAEICPWYCDGVVCEHFKDRSKFVELPFKTGDRIYVVDIRLEKIIERIITEIRITDCDTIYAKCYGFSYPSYSFGKTVFLTKEEAEQALAERSGK